MTCNVIQGVVKQYLVCFRLLSKPFSILTIHDHAIFIRLPTCKIFKTFNVSLNECASNSQVIITTFLLTLEGSSASYLLSWRTLKQHRKPPEKNIYICLTKIVIYINLDKVIEIFILNAEENFYKLNTTLQTQICDLILTTEEDFVL